VTLDGSLTDFTLAVDVNTTGLAGAAVSGPVTTFFVANSGNPSSLTLGTLISAANATGPGGDLSRHFAGSPFPTKTGNWDYSGSPAYLGLAFDISGSTHYGWAQLAVNISNSTPQSSSVTLIDYAYQDQAGIGINAGATTETVPEPSTLALFALGAAGVIALRRRWQSRA